MMETKTQSLQKDLVEIKRELIFIRNILTEDFELSAYAKRSLKEARKTPKSKYISHEELKKRLLK